MAKIKRMDVIGNAFGVFMIVLFVVGMFFLIKFTNSLIASRINNIVAEIKQDCRK